MINSLAIFQAIINKLLRDLINTRNIESFIDDVIIRTESEERIGRENIKKNERKWFVCKIRKM